MIPPQHSLRANMRVILPSDPAVDMDRVAAEIEDLEGEDLMAHPWMLYTRGVTRFDIDGTKGLSDYIDWDKNPTVWHCRRLDPEEWIDVQDVANQGRPHRAAMDAFYLCVKKVENAGDLSDLFDGEKRPTRSKIKAALAAYSNEVASKVGQAIIAGSRDLTEQEKKVSG